MAGLKVLKAGRLDMGRLLTPISAKNNLIAYVKNQEEHHKTWSYREELLALLKEHEIEWDERYLE